MARRTIVVGLDVGTTKTTALVGEVDGEHRVHIIGVGECPSSGLRKGTIVDIDNTVKSIDRAIEKAERMSGVHVEAVCVGIAGANISSVNNRGVIAVAGPDREITAEDVERVLQAARVIHLPADRRIIHVIPRQYLVDGYDGVRDPVGMAGSRLEVETNIITGAATSIQNMLKSIHRAGLKLQDLVLNPLASGEAVLLPAEKELGVVVVDIGGGTTDIAIYDQGSPWFTSVLPIGGDYVTSDLAVGLRTTLAEAERVKREMGCVLADLAPDNEYVEITSVGGKEVNRVSRKLLATIIEPRMQEIIAIIRNEIYRSGYKGILPGGVVLTGGAVLMDGLVELARTQFNLPVRIGVPEGIGGISDVVSSPAYATAVGLVLYAAKKLHSSAGEEDDPLLGKFFAKVKSWFREFF
ncbi:MAG: cell division protein FtsA [Firmicutes bacterium]|nr:cell division protein FtsA [Bacillota bacterium]